MACHLFEQIAEKRRIYRFVLQLIDFEISCAILIKEGINWGL